MKSREFAAQPPDVVLNQPPPLENYNLYADDTPLREAVQREGGGWIEARACDFGALLGRAETLRLGQLANEYTPVLHSYDRFGRRIDEVEYHPAYHEQMRMGVEWELHSMPWTSGQPGAHVARAAATQQLRKSCAFAFERQHKRQPVRVEEIRILVPGRKDQ